MKVKARKPIRRISERQKNRLSEYYKVARKFKREHPTCYVCTSRGRRRQPTEDVHHTRGRVGKLLTNTLFFIPACRECHDFIGTNIDWARDKGFICEKGKWGSNN